LSFDHGQCVAALTVALIPLLLAGAVCRTEEEPMRCIAVIGIIAIACLPTLATPAWAAIEYPWCAQYSGEDGGGRNCGFSTLEQCLATVSGIGGFCEPNLFYPGSASDTSKSKRKRQR
jgi:hypothetical protein